MRAQEIVLDDRQIVGGGAFGRAGDDQHMRQQVLEGQHLGVLAGDAHVGVAVGAADVNELARIVRGRHVADQRLQDDPGKSGADRGAVLRRQRIDVAGRFVTAGARHVLRHDGRVAGNVTTDIPRNQPRISVVAAAGRRADDEVDVLALVELLDGVLGVRARGREAGEDDQRARAHERVRPSHWCDLPKIQCPARGRASEFQTMRGATRTRTGPRRRMGRSGRGRRQIAELDEVRFLLFVARRQLEETCRGAA